MTVDGATAVHHRLVWPAAVAFNARNPFAYRRPTISKRPSPFGNSEIFILFYNNTRWLRHSLRSGVFFFSLTNHNMLLSNYYYIFIIIPTLYISFWIVRNLVFTFKLIFILYFRYDILRVNSLLPKLRHLIFKCT